jgi:restriction endonuclease S subunit
MYKKLEDIGRITTGVYEKGRPSGDTLYLQAKHFSEQGKFRSDSILSPEIHMDDRLEKHTLQDKDLLVTAKGESNRVCLYQSEIGQSVASSTFFVIRLQESSILPEYLQWYLNTSKMQSFLSSLSKGTHILSLSKKSLSKVKIEIPPLEQQQEVLNLQSLWETERKTTLELLEQKELFYQYMLLNLATSKLIKK